MKLNEMFKDIKCILLLVFALVLGVFLLIGGIYLAPGFGLLWQIALITIFGFVGFALFLAFIIWPLIQDAPANILKILLLVMGLLGILSFVFWLFIPFGWVLLPWFLWIDLFAGIIVIVFVFLCMKKEI
ncbi:MAG: hypothetical protein KAU62_03885 [Candidatus Heimdallarchaeota archaeon]|nr:hypothetical protein [Candidatus Heimdallarchaeota archaeon]MCG3255205.1 hypothetical protein [Candidatus Heimdallarchaeota archaeon]MCK4610277.1 hypothetical protein [Candidatus Heimdallarchaeota archaeon]